MAKMKVLLAIVFLVLFSSSVLAFSEIEVQPMNDHIVFGQKAIYNVSITNQRDVTQTYELFSPTSGIGWSVVTRPLRNRMVTIGGNGTAMIEVVVEPIEKFPPGVYIVNLDITTNFGENYQMPLRIYMGPVLPSEYLPAIRTTVDMNDRIDPRETQSIKIFIENLNPLDLTGMVVRIVSDIPELNMEQTVDLAPNDHRAVEVTVKLPDTQQPKEYFVFFQFERNDEIIKVVDKKIEVLPLAVPFIQKIDEQKSFLKKKQVITFSNPGNVRNTQTMRVDVGAIESVFTTTSPKARLVKDANRRAFAWDIELGPDEERKVETTTSYQIPFAVLIIVLISIPIYQVYRNPFAITKSASDLVVEEGGVSALKVTLVVKNLGSSVLKDIEILDEIPSIAAVEKDVEMGTLKPSQMLQGRGGSIFARWKLSELEGKEERLITYKLKSRLNIIGTMQLPRAKAAFSTGNGKKKVSYSNIYRVSTGE